MSNTVVYLDRDGTINEDFGYVSDPRDLVLKEGVVEGLKLLSTRRIPIVVVTNQSGIGRGYFTTEQMEEFHDHLRNTLCRHGVALQGILVCPHAPGDDCQCRKPKPGLIRLAEHAWGKRRGVMVGDSERDIRAGIAADVATVALGDPGSEMATLADRCVSDFYSAASAAVELLTTERSW